MNRCLNCGCPEGEHWDKPTNSVSEGNPCWNTQQNHPEPCPGFRERKKKETKTHA
jgi:hypothetical protein